MEQTKTINLVDLTESVLTAMKNAGFCAGYLKQMRFSCTRLKEFAHETGKDFLDEELERALLNDTAHIFTGQYSKSRFERHRRFLNLLQSFRNSGVLDYTPVRRDSRFAEIKSEHLLEAQTRFVRYLNNQRLARNTIDGYLRIVRHFLIYCERTGISDIETICPVNIRTFLEYLCTHSYKPTSLGSHLPGLKLFISSNETLNHILPFFPTAPKRKVGIIPVLDAADHEKLRNHLTYGEMSKRDRAICWLAFETGLRAIDIHGITINDIDWVNDRIYIMQAKTSKPLELPLRATYGNAIADYLLNERPVSDSRNLFLRASAPYRALEGHNAYRTVIRKAFRNAGILKDDVPCGTRFTRHNAASHMLAQGVPPAEISAALGHRNPDSVSCYLSTDDDVMSQCCLPMPHRTEVTIIG